MDYKDILENQKEVNSFLAEDDCASALEKHEFVMKMMMRLVKYGEIIVGSNYKERMEMCSMLAEIADDYKAFVENVMNRRNEKS